MATTNSFRETQWFKLGHQQQVAEPAGDDGDDDDAPSATVMMLPIEDRYADDGAITAEDTATFGLHTGTTEYIRLGIVPLSTGDDTEVGALVREMKFSRPKLLAIGASAIAACTAFALYLV